MTDTEQAKYKAGDRLHFAPLASRAPHGSAIRAGAVTVVEVVDHGSPTPYSPRFTYVVRALDGSGMQGTDDRELSEPEPVELPEPMAIFPRDGYTILIYAARDDADAVVAHYLALGVRVDTPDDWTAHVYEPGVIARRPR